MSLPYRWYPSGTSTKTVPDEGDLVPLEHVVYRVVEVRFRDEVDWKPEDIEAVARIKPEFRARHVPHVLRLRPLGREDADADKHLSSGGANHYRWNVYRDEHYPACGKCGEPAPCREVMMDRLGKQAMRQFERWNNRNQCPACEQPFGPRQKTQTFSDNIHVPGGPPVTFHAGRRGCAYAARRYAEAMTTGTSSPDLDHRPW